MSFKEPSKKIYTSLLKEYFGYEKLRDSQSDALKSLANGNVLAVMPTGSGKSMIYILPSILNSYTIVISPLISLMQDQFNKLSGVGINVGFINSSISESQRNQNLQNFKKGKIKALFIAPERFSVPGFFKNFKNLEINLLAIDEAHCISEWGHNFRPDYLNLYEVRKELKPKRTLAMTATADDIVQQDIIKRLNMDCEKILTGFNRPNLFFDNVLITSEEKQNEYILKSLSKSNEGSAIVYCRTRKSVELTSEYLNNNGINSLAYHAGFDSNYRRDALDNFMADNVDVIVATTAFGMGIDKPDVRTVFHKGMPSRLEEYYQQAGRAGRDGKNAKCVLLYRKRDFSTQEKFVKDAYPTSNELKRIWDKLIDITQDDEIFDPDQLNKFFTEFGYNTESRINMAINCFRSSRLIDPIHYKISNRDKNPKFNNQYLDRNYDESMKKLKKMINYCQTSTCLRSVLLQYFGENYDCFGKGCCTDALDQAEINIHLEGNNNNDLSSEKLIDLDYKERLEKLKEWRSLKAKETGWSPFIFFNNSELEEIALKNPSDEISFKKIKGVGNLKLKKYGKEILQILSELRINDISFANNAENDEDLQKIKDLENKIKSIEAEIENLKSNIEQKSNSDEKKYYLEGEVFKNYADYYDALKKSENFYNAYKSWKAEEDKKLLQLKDSMSIKELSLYFKRKDGAIRSRLKKLTEN